MIIVCLCQAQGVVSGIMAQHRARGLVDAKDAVVKDFV